MLGGLQLRDRGYDRLSTTLKARFHPLRQHYFHL
jgi:hypothetical protein